MDKNSFFSVLAEDAIKAALNDYKIKQESLTKNQKQYI